MGVIPLCRPLCRPLRRPKPGEKGMKDKIAVVTAAGQGIGRAAAPGAGKGLARGWQTVAPPFERSTAPPKKSPT